MRVRARPTALSLTLFALVFALVAFACACADRTGPRSAPQTVQSASHAAPPSPPPSAASTRSVQEGPPEAPYEPEAGAARCEAVEVPAQLAERTRGHALTSAGQLLLFRQVPGSPPQDPLAGGDDPSLPTRQLAFAVRGLPALSAVSLARNGGCGVGPDQQASCFWLEPDGCTLRGQPRALGQLAELTTGVAKILVQAERDATFEVLALTRDGALYALRVSADLGTPPAVTRVRLASAAKDVAADMHEVCVLSQQGDVSCARGDDAFARVVGLRDVVQLGVAGESRCALDRRGYVHCWGRSLEHAPHPAAARHEQVTFTTPRRVASLPPIDELTLQALGSSACGRAKSGDVYCWGQQGGGRACGRERFVVPPKRLSLHDVSKLEDGCALDSEGWQCWECWP